MRYQESLTYNIAMCDFLLRTVGWDSDEDSDLQQEAVDFLNALRDGWRAELRDMRGPPLAQSPNVHRWEPSPFDAQG